MITALANLFAAGGWVMWLILADALLLYLLLAERSLCLFRPSAGLELPAEELAGHLHEAHRLGHEHLLDRAELIRLADQQDLSRRFAIIRCLIVIAPLLGLLGTVDGMITTFNGILAGRRAAAATVGIAEALLTTQFGLMVAVPALLIESLLVRRRDQVAQDREQIRAGCAATAGTARP